MNVLQREDCLTMKKLLVCIALLLGVLPLRCTDGRDVPIRCIFPFQSNALTVGENQLCCNYSSLSIAPPRVFVGGTLQGNLQNAQHSTCDIVYLVPVSQRLDGLEIAVSYGTMTEGRWNTTIYFPIQELAPRRNPQSTASTMEDTVSPQPTSTPDQTEGHAPGTNCGIGCMVGSILGILFLFFFCFGGCLCYSVLMCNAMGIRIVLERDSQNIADRASEQRQTDSSAARSTLAHHNPSKDNYAFEEQFKTCRTEGDGQVASGEPQQRQGTSTCVPMEAFEKKDHAAADHDSAMVSEEAAEETGAYTEAQPCEETSFDHASQPVVYEAHGKLVLPPLNHSAGKSDNFIAAPIGCVAANKTQEPQ